MKQLSYIVFGMFYLAFVTEINSLKFVRQKQIGKVILKTAIMPHRQVFTSSNDAKRVERDTLYRLMPDGHRDMVVKRGLPGALVSDDRKEILVKRDRPSAFVSDERKKMLVQRDRPGALMSDGRKKPLVKPVVLMPSSQKRSLFVTGDDSVYGTYTVNLPDGRRQRSPGLTNLMEVQLYD